MSEFFENLSVSECEHIATLLRDDAKLALEDDDFNRAYMDLRIAQDFSNWVSYL